LKIDGTNNQIKVQYNIQIDNKKQQEEDIANKDSMPIHSFSLRGVISKN
jgi:hypothetical protein